MRFRRVPLARARGHILGHNITSAGRRLLKKGRRLWDPELARIAETGADATFVAELEPTDVLEDEAALRIARALATDGLEVRAAHGGRVSLLARARGVWSVRSELLRELNGVAGVTLATLPNHCVVGAEQLVATLKIIPFALPEASVARAETIAARGLARLLPLRRRRVSVVVHGAEGRRETLLGTFREPLAGRIAALGAGTATFTFVTADAQPEEALAVALRRQLESGAELIILAGETATMDTDDVAPRAIRLAGGTVEGVGAPVFPGNLLLLGYFGSVAVVGAPGCVRSRSANVVDLILPRLLAGERLGMADIAELGLGGLLAGAEAGAAEELQPGPTGIEERLQDRAAPAEPRSERRGGSR